jgi:hypothetical protein
VTGTSAVFRYNDLYAGTLTFQSTSQQSFFYLNNLYGGSVQDNGFDNRFDTGSIGNYWTGFSANDSNGDGTWDSPRTIAGSAGNTDRYPLVSPFGGVANVTATPPDLTASPDALVDSSRGVLIPMAGLQPNVSYDLTITNITPTGAGFGYLGSGYGYGGASTSIELLGPNGTRVNEQLAYADAVHSGQANVSYPGQLLDATGRWAIVANGFELASFTVNPTYLAPSGAPNPSAGNATVRAYDVQEMRVSYPAGGRIMFQRSYDLTFTNITTVGGEHRLHAPNGTAANNASSYADGLHGSRLNATFAGVLFPVSGVWTLRGPDNATLAAFDVDGAPGVNPFLANLTLALGNRSDEAAFGAAANATPEYDPAFDLSEPPAPLDPSYVRLFSTTPAGTLLSKSTLSTNGTLVWNFTAQAEGLNGTSIVSWNATEISQVNAMFDVELVVGATTLDMRQTTSHSFASNASHSFTMRVRQSAGLRLDATAVVVTPILVVGGALHVSGSVNNDGPDAAVDAFVTLELDNGTSFTIGTTPSTIPVGANATFAFAGVNQTVPGAHTATVRVNSSSADANTANNAVTKGYFVTTASLDLTALTSVNATVSPGTNVTFTLRAQNTGNANETYSFNASGAPQGWNTSLSASNATLAAGANTTFSLTVTAPSSVTAIPRSIVTIEGIAASDSTIRDVIVVDTTLVVTETINVPDGWALLSVPVTPQNVTIAAVFGPSVQAAYGWNGTSYQSVSSIVPGRAYWVLSAGATNVNVTGTPLRNVTITLAAGWNLVGSPIAGASIQEVPTNVSSTAFFWNGSGYQETSALQSGRGYWLYVHNTSANVILGVGVVLEPSLPIRGEDTFSLRVRVGVGGMEDTFIVERHVGASTGFGSDDLPKAPLAPVASQVRAVVVALDGTRAMDLHRSAEPPTQVHNWPVNAGWADLSGPVSLSWDTAALARLPATTRIELQDGMTRIDMRALPTYAFAPLPGETMRTLRVVFVDGELDGVCLVSVEGSCVSTAPTARSSIIG